MALRSKEEIDTELARLAECRKYIPNYHKSTLDAQVEVLTERMTHGEIFDKWSEEALLEDFDQELLDGVIEAENWMYGNSDEAPHVNWREFKNN